MRKKEFSSFDVAAVVRELRNLILGSRTVNIYQTDSKTLFFKLHKPENPTLWLVLEAGRRLHLTSYAVEKPLAPPAFCKALRKHLRNSVLTNIEQYEFERTITFSFKIRNSVLKLIMEVFSDGNFILVDEHNNVLHALTYKRMKDRNILRGEPFVFAPSSSKNPLKVSLQEFNETIKSFSETEVVRALARFLSIGGLYAEEVLLRAGVDKKLQCNALDENAAAAIFDCLRLLLSQVLDCNLEPCIVLDVDGILVDVVPIRLKRYEGLRAKHFGSFNEALDEFYIRLRALETALSANTEVEALNRELERFKRIAESQERIIAEAKIDAEHYKRIGDTIYARSSELQLLLDKFILGVKSGKSWNEVVSEILAEKEKRVNPSVFFESFDAKKLMINVCVDDLRFSLDLRCKLFDAAAKFYERSKKAKQRLEGAKISLEDTRKKMAEVEAKIMETKTLETAKPVTLLEDEIEKTRIRHKGWFEKFRWFKSSEGFLVIAGKDAVSNEVLIKKYTSPEDVVFHADITGAPFVVIKTDGKQPTTQCLKEAAEFAAAHSRGWREGFATVDVYWVKPEQVRKTAPSGEYVPRGAFVISGKRNWMRNTPLKIAIGTIINEKTSEIKLTAEPVDAVKAKTQNYVILVPGDTSVKELYKQIIKRLAEKTPKEIREKIQKTTFEEIRTLIPYDKGQIQTQT